MANASGHATWRPEVKLQIGNETFTGRVEVIADRARIEHVTDRLAAKSLVYMAVTSHSRGSLGDRCRVPGDRGLREQNIRFLTTPSTWC